MVNYLCVSQIVGSPRFPHVSQLMLDGPWKNVELIESIASLVCLSNLVTLVRLERTPTVIFQALMSRLTNLQALRLTKYVLDALDAAKFQHLSCLDSLEIVQLDDADAYHPYVNVEPFCTMFPRVKHLDIPIDHLDSCQYVLDRLKSHLISVIFRFLVDDDDEDENSLVQWAEDMPDNHQYRVHDGDIYLWLR